MDDPVTQLLDGLDEQEDLVVDRSHSDDVTFSIGRRQVGHVHDQALHVPLPRSVRDEVIESGLGETHPFNPDSGWVEVPLEEESDLRRARELLNRACRLAREANEKKDND